MRLKSALLAATVLAMPVAVQAQPITGLYVGVGAGANFKQQQDFSSLSGNVGPGAGLSSSGSNLSLNYSPGWVGLASVGYGLGNGLRFEVEGNYRNNNLSSLHGTPFPTKADGNEQTYGAMANVLYDFDIAPYTGITWMYPYLGVGAGYGWTSFHAARAAGTNYPFFGKTNDIDGNFAYQAIAGIAFPIDAVPGLSLTAEYRFYSVIGDTTFHGAVDTLGGRTFGSAKLNDQYNNSAIVGIRYAFNTAPPPPPPVVVAPAPAPARSYLVFFDWDKYNLTDRARQIIKEAAVNSTKTQVTRIDVNGYADTSGTPKYNLGLSIRRANAVKAELVRNGVPASEITTKGFGDTVLLVPTGPGVREPQNRRVEIILH